MSTHQMRCGMVVYNRFGCRAAPKNIAYMKTLRMTRDTTMADIKKKLGHTDAEIWWKGEVRGDGETLFQLDIGKNETMHLIHPT